MEKKNKIKGGVLKLPSHADKSPIKTMVTNLSVLKAT